MNRHDFIFSNSLRYRIARHAVFLLACWIFFMITYYIPTAVFPAWSTEKFAGNIARIGLLKWLWFRLLHSTITLLPLLAFAYTIIYFLLPRLFFNKKNWVITIILFTGILFLFLGIQYGASYWVDRNLTHVSPAYVSPGYDGLINRTLKTILWNYPVVVGFTVIIKMLKWSWLKQQETEQIVREKANAELQLLKAQIHPHFLFNTLNNIYFFTLTASQKAPEILTKLSGILHYILDECTQPLVPLEKELKMIEDYIGLEKIRYGDRLKMEFEINGDHSQKMIPPLLLIPLVENSFKHGVSKMLEQPWVNLTITLNDQYLYFLLSNSRPDEMILSHHNGHIGLKNVKKRLQLLLPAAHELKIAESKQSFEVFLKIRLEPSYVSERGTKETTKEYAMA